MKDISLFQLIKEATGMLMDRQEIEQDLIYYICKLTDEERTAIILAYQNIRSE
jgi:hypothetical protein